LRAAKVVGGLLVTHLQTFSHSLDENGEYSFIMPFYSPTLTGIFAEKSTSSSSVSSAAVSYAAPAVAAPAEEPAEPEEEKQPEMIDVMPTVAAVMANTMLVVTTTVNMM
jgi:hypothetical protein